MNKGIVFVCDIADDIDDKIVVEYLHNQGNLRCVVLDRPSSAADRVQELKRMGVIFVDDIPDTDVVFCGGSLTKVAEYLENPNNKLTHLVCNGGFAGCYVIPPRSIKSKSSVENMQSEPTTLI